MNNNPANELIKQLLNKNSEARMSGSFSQLKNHEFFKDIDWH